jgi:saccharopine dehydrogenase-like NADP-dependent oxidoreductase
VSPRDVVAAVLPDPAFLGEEMTGRTSAGTWLRGIGTDGNPREVYLYHVVDTEETWAKDGTQAVTWQTAINPVIALELVANGTWSGAGVLGPEAFDAVPFLDMLKEYGSPWGMTEMKVNGSDDVYAERGGASRRQADSTDR